MRRSESTIRKTCLTGGSPLYPVADEVPVSVPVSLPEVGEVLGDAEACATSWPPPPPPPALTPPPPAEPAPDAFDPAACTVTALGVVCARPTTISGALASVATLVPPTSEPTITPNPSIPMTAAAAARGPGSANCSPRGDGRPTHPTHASRPESARGVPGGSVAAGPCSRKAPISPATCSGNGPRRVPQSTQ